MISGLIAFAARNNPAFAGIASDLRDRIMALGRAHDFVRPHSPQSRPKAQQDSLHGLLSDLFDPYRRDNAPRSFCRATMSASMIVRRRLSRCCSTNWRPMPPNMVRCR